MQNPNPPAQTVARAVDLLRLIASSRSQHLRLIDVANMAGLEKSTAHRLLQRLVEERLLVRVAKQRGYRLGPLLYELGLCALPEKNLKETCHPELRRLADQTGDMAFLVVRSGYETVCLDRIAGSFPIQTMTSGIGDRHPLGVGAGGIAILAALSDAETESVLQILAPQLTRYERCNTETLRASVHRARLRGYAFDEGSAAVGVSALGMAVRLPSKIPVAAVFMASISSRMDPTRQTTLSKRLAACVRAMESDLT